MDLAVGRTVFAGLRAGEALAVGQRRLVYHGEYPDAVCVYLVQALQERDAQGVIVCTPQERCGEADCPYCGESYAV